MRVELALERGPGNRCTRRRERHGGGAIELAAGRRRRDVPVRGRARRRRDLARRARVAHDDRLVGADHDADQVPGPAATIGVAEVEGAALIPAEHARLRDEAELAARLDRAVDREGHLPVLGPDPAAVPTVATIAAVVFGRGRLLGGVATVPAVAAVAARLGGRWTSTAAARGDDDAQHHHGAELLQNL